MAVKNGDNVLVHYKGTLEDGEVFDSSEGREPLGFSVGAGQVIAGFDKAVMNMEPGQTKTVNIPVDEAYGERSQEALISIPRSEFPDDIDPQIGDSLQLTDEQGHIFDVEVAELADDHIILDANHPLAGKDLTFEITLVSVN